MAKFLDGDGLGYFWGKVKAYVQQQIQAVGALTGVKGDAESTYRTGNVNLTPANLGLGNVDNTSDASKPISTATQAALDGKADAADLGDLAYLDEVPNHSTAKLTSGTLGVARGGTGKASHTVNSILTGGTTTTGAVQDVATASGALYATSANGAASFGTLPIAQGGTGKTSAADAWGALGGGSIGKKNSLAASDIPNHSTSKLTSGTLGIARGGTGSTGTTSKLNNSNATIYIWGKLVMVQLHGQAKTPDGTAIWSTAYLADYKPEYNVSAIVAATTGELARVWVGASDGKVYLSAVNTSTSKAWYGTLVYMLA